MKLFLTLLGVMGMGIYSSQAQEIKGKVKEAEGAGLPKATVSLLKAADSSVVKYEVTDEEGAYLFKNNTSGKYLILVSNVGFMPAYSAPFELGTAGITLPDIALEKIAEEMEAVVVRAQKPLVEVKADKMVINVEGTINAQGNDGLELLRKSPGVLIDKDENISLSGKNGVQVYIDGKPSPLSGSDLAAFLKSIQSSQVESIELITNPSARFEAAGNAGIINIKLKKNKAFGTNGSVNLGYGIGTYAKYNGGLSLNHRNARVNAFMNYSYNDSRNWSGQTIWRQLMDSTYDGKTNMRMNMNNHGFKAGLDYTLNAKNTIGAMVNGTVAEVEMNSKSNTAIYGLTNRDEQRVLRAGNVMNAPRHNINANVNYRYAGTDSRILNVDLDYGINKNDGNQFQPNEYFDKNGQLIFARNVRMLSPSDIDIYSGKIDYEQNLGKGRLSTGTKISFVESDNRFKQFDVKGMQDAYDSSRSNNFLYKENINAGYVSYAYPFNGFSVNAGVRVENTNIEGLSTGHKLEDGRYVPFDSSFKRSYTDFFPNISLSFNKNPMSQFSVSYSKRIDRPAYRNLNPFEFRLDENTYQRGNINLRPQYTNSFGITHSYKYRLTTTLNYSRVKDLFSQILDSDGYKSVNINENLANQDVVSLNVSYPFNYQWYTLFANVNANYSKYKANFGPDRKINLDAFTYTVYAQNAFKVGKTISAELTALYISPSIFMGTFESKSMWSIDAGVQKTILKGKGNVKASVTDIFQGMKFRGASNFSGQVADVVARWESRQFKVSFNWRFGRNEIKPARNRKTGLEDETQRAEGGGQGGGIGTGGGQK